MAQHRSNNSAVMCITSILLVQFSTTTTIYKQSEKKRLLLYFDEAQYNKVKFMTRDMLRVFKFISKKLPRTDNSINNCLIIANIWQY